MTVASSLRKEISKATSRGAAWLERKMFHGGAPWDSDISASYRTPLALWLCDRRDAATAILKPRERTLLTQISSYRGRPPRELSRTWTRITNFHEFPLYQPAWLTITAQATGFPVLARSTFDYVMMWYSRERRAIVLHDAHLGSYLELVQCAAAGMACLTMGRPDVARELAATLTTTLIEALRRDKLLPFRIRADESRGAILPSHAAMAHLYQIVPRQSAQFYWVLGLIVWFLSEEAVVGGEGLDEVVAELFAFLDICCEDWRTFAPWKLAGAFARLASTRLSQPLRARVLGELTTLATNLLHLQRSDGSWGWPESGGADFAVHAEPEPMQVTVDCTAETILWLHQVGPALDGAPAPGF